MPAVPALALAMICLAAVPAGAAVRQPDSLVLQPGALMLPAGGATVPPHAQSDASPAAAAAPTVGPAAAEVVFLVPGLGRSPRSMRRIERDLSARGYRVVNLPFDSRRENIDQLADLLAERVARFAPSGAGRVHFVTHSMGAIVVREYLARRPPPNLGRVVMLSPPNGGCEVVDLLHRVPILGDHLGPSRGALGTRPEDAPGRLGPVEYEVGVIAGGRSYNPLFSWILPGEDDGVVAVDRMRVAGMRELRVVPRSHSFIMNGRDTIALTAGFLENGTFGPPPRAL